MAVPPWPRSVLTWGLCTAACEQHRPQVRRTHRSTAEAAGCQLLSVLVEGPGALLAKGALSGLVAARQQAAGSRQQAAGHLSKYTPPWLHSCVVLPDVPFAIQRAVK
jgi:hypothetical protein